MSADYPAGSVDCLMSFYAISDVAANSFATMDIEDRNAATARFNKLVDRGEAERLSSPLLRAMSGKVASFLIGGVIARTQRNYGMTDMITPTIESDGSISSKLEFISSMPIADSKFPAFVDQRLQVNVPPVRDQSVIFSQRNAQLANLFSARRHTEFRTLVTTFDFSVTPPVVTSTPTASASP